MEQPQPPADVPPRDFTLHYEGGIDPTRRFEFSISPSDYAAIRRYRDYGPTPGGSGFLTTPTTVQAHESGRFYYLDYSTSRDRCTFQLLDY
jgi:hypothetical protein